MSEYWDRAELEASLSPHVWCPLEAACSSSLVMADCLVAEADLPLAIPADHQPVLQSREAEASEQGATLPSRRPRQNQGEPDSLLDRSLRVLVWE